MQRQIIVSLVLVVVLLSGGVLTLGVLVRTRPRPPRAATAQPPLAVRAVKLEPRTTVEPITGYGTAKADRFAWVATQVAGEIIELAEDLRSGAAVTGASTGDQAQGPARGQLLVRIDEREYRAALDRATSQLAGDQAALLQFDVEQSNLEGLVKIAEEELAVTERELNLIKDLLERGSSNPREADQARLEFARARRTLQTLFNQQALLPQRRAQQEAICALRRAEVAVARLNVERCTIYAPFAGRLDQVNIELGERVRPGDRLLSIVDPVHIEVPIELPVSLRGRVRVGAPCRLTLESRTEALWSGRVARIAPSANELTRTFPLFVEVDNSEQAQPLIPGMFVRARIDGPTWTDALIVPRGCIQEDNVFVCRDGRALRQTVQVERHLLDRSIITGLEAGEIVITSNLDALYDGAPVEVLLDQVSAAPVLNRRPTPGGGAGPHVAPLTPRFPTFSPSHLLTRLTP